MSVAEKIAALFNALTLADVRRMPPVERRRFADCCRHWAEVAETRTENPKSGLSDLKRGQRAE